LAPASAITVLGVLVPRDASGYAALESKLNKTRDALKSDGVSVLVELKTGYPAEAVIECADAHQADLVVLGAKGLRHTLGIFLGGVAQQVVEYSSRPVLVVRAPYRGLRRVMLVTDGSAHSTGMLKFLCGSDDRSPFPLPAGVEIQLVHVTPPPGLSYSYIPSTYVGPDLVVPMEEFAARQDLEESQGREILSKAAETLQQAGIEATTVLLNGDAATEIIEYAQENQVDLIIAGSRGLSPARRWLLGSVSRKLVHYAGCSVLVAK
ncbi:MAG: universal stress protein, partial [Chloroflexota bacterium]